MADNIKIRQNLQGVASLRECILLVVFLLLILAKDRNNLKSYEISFSASNFLHFTGMNAFINANKFYKAAINGRLSVKDFNFKDEQLTSMKLDVLQEAMNLPYSAKMIGLYMGAKKELKADIGAGNVHCVMTLRFKSEADRKLYPVGVQKEDIRNVTAKEPIVAIFRKNKNVSLYDEMTYKSKNINIDKLHIPQNIRKQLSEKAYQILKPAVET